MAGVRTVDLMKKGLRRKMLGRLLPLIVRTVDLMKKGLRPGARATCVMQVLVRTVDLMKKGLRHPPWDTVPSGVVSEP